MDEDPRIHWITEPSALDPAPAPPVASRTSRAAQVAGVAVVLLVSALLALIALGLLAWGMLAVWQQVLTGWERAL